MGVNNDQFEHPFLHVGSAVTERIWVNLKKANSDIAAVVNPKQDNSKIFSDGNAKETKSEIPPVVDPKKVNSEIMSDNKPQAGNSKIPSGANPEKAITEVVSDVNPNFVVPSVVDPTKVADSPIDEDSEPVLVSVETCNENEVTPRPPMIPDNSISVIVSQNKRRGTEAPIGYLDSAYPINWRQGIYQVMPDGSSQPGPKLNVENLLQGVENHGPGNLTPEVRRKFELLTRESRIKQNCKKPIDLVTVAASKTSQPWSAAPRASGVKRRLEVNQPVYGGLIYSDGEELKSTNMDVVMQPVVVMQPAMEPVPVLDILPHTYIQNGNSLSPVYQRASIIRVNRPVIR